MEEENTDMADLPHNSNNDDRPGTPRWVKAFGIIGIVLALLFAILKFAGLGGEHGPSRHAPPSITTEDSVQQP